VVMIQSAGIHPLTYTEHTAGHWSYVSGAITQEALVSIHVNGVELATFMCTPRRQDELAVGFLRAEGIIQSMAEVRKVVVCPSGACVEVWLRDGAAELPVGRRAIITSGCGGGVTFDDLSGQIAPLNTSTRLTPDQLFARMRDLYQAAELYGQTQGIHTSALTDGARLLLVAEDIGRHNTLDRLWGQALQQGLDPAGHILLATGRISSEMLGKAARMRVPIIASRTSPTSLSVKLGRAWNITVIGYVRRNSFRVYAAEERIVPTAQLAAPVVGG
jgi:FdhD protein